ncbi:MAG: hypothetical protein PHH59_04805 [Methylovulum sp.]|uniref:hypothetical protein n=1 Tax=Methylovulum sp. TaxID=1916980 RepID=UPI0026041588|nr:hypothetical protein [Methylovulum sp.]MDD2723331.1 hypothetical protein [Methylovulum sp.]MDD5124680.1 hypothetical protein [Methylovulum sp.]
MKASPLLSMLTMALMTISAGCSTTPEQTPVTTPVAGQTLVNDFPTRDRVEYVLNCVAQHGGLNYINQYACGCKIDKIAEKLSFSDYEAAKTFNYLKSTPGESGGVFRDPKQSKDLRAQLKEADAYAEKSCFVK